MLWSFYGVRCWQCFCSPFIVDSCYLTLLKQPFASGASSVKYRSVNVLLQSYNCPIIHNLLFGTWSYLQPSRTLPTLLLLLFGGKKLRLGSHFLKFLYWSIHPELCLSCFLRCTLESVLRQGSLAGSTLQGSVLWKELPFNNHCFDIITGNHCLLMTDNGVLCLETL